MSAAWRALLEGEEAAAARAAATDVARALAASGWDDPSLYHGQAGIALLHGALARAGDDDAAGAAGEALALAVGSLAGERRPWLVRGAAGVGLALALLRDVVEVDDTLGELDDILLSVVTRDDAIRAWELLDGVTGLGVYGLERAAAGAPAGRALVERVVHHLAALGERDGAGAARMRTRATDELAPEAAAENPDGFFSLGFAYGNLGPLAFLAGARALGADAAAPWLLDEGVAWLRAQDRPGAPFRFPQYVARGVVEPPDRASGWCYGDAITALVLVAAGRSASRPDWSDHGLAVARHAITREAAAAQAGDLSLCHGQVGRGHIYARLAQVAGAADLADAARGCYRGALAARATGGLAGFDRISRAPGTTGDLFTRGLQLGAAGVALGLLAAASEEPPAWDRALLVTSLDQQ